MFNIRNGIKMENTSIFPQFVEEIITQSHRKLRITKSQMKYH